MGKKIKVMSVFGTRPEAIKMLPLVHEIKRRENLEGVVCVTAQHREMLDQVLKTFDTVPDYDLNIMKPRQTISSITTDCLLGVGEVLEEARPDIVLVHGDTTTSFAAALAAFYRQVDVGHVEAGLRTFDKYSPFPEEMNRVLTGDIATLHFSPTRVNAQNLSNENIKNNVYVVGNTVIDALFYIVRKDYTFDEPQLRQLDYEKYRTILVTSHRRENFGRPMRNIFTAIRRLAEDFPDVQVVYPVHKNPIVRDAARAILEGVPRVHLIEPLAVEDMHNLMQRSYLILTDSGGIQEEAPALGKPVLVLRTETERPEAVETGVVRVVGVEEDAVYGGAKQLLCDRAEYEKMSQAQNPYGDGHTSERICDIITEYYANK